MLPPSWHAIIFSPPSPQVCHEPMSLTRLTIQLFDHFGETAWLTFLDSLSIDIVSLPVPVEFQLGCDLPALRYIIYLLAWELVLSIAHVASFLAVFLDSRTGRDRTQKPYQRYAHAPYRAGTLLRQHVLTIFLCLGSPLHIAFLNQGDDDFWIQSRFYSISLPRPIQDVCRSCQVQTTPILWSHDHGFLYALFSPWESPQLHTGSRYAPCFQFLLRYPPFVGVCRSAKSHIFLFYTHHTPFRLRLSLYGALYSNRVCCFRAVHC